MNNKINKNRMNKNKLKNKKSKKIFNNYNKSISQSKFNLFSNNKFSNKDK